MTSFANLYDPVDDMSNINYNSGSFRAMPGMGGVSGSGFMPSDIGAFAAGNLNPTAFNAQLGNQGEGGFLSGIGAGFNKLTGGMFKGFGGFSQVGANGPTLGQKVWGYLGKDGSPVKGLASSGFGMLKDLGMGYLAWQNVKNQEDQLALQREMWMKNWKASVHDYNNQVRSVNVARASRKGGAHQMAELEA